MKLKIAAKIDRVDREYFETTIRPMIDGDQIEMIGEIGEPEKPPSSAAPRPCCCRSTGPNPSDW